jgi:hypothetical protein
MALRDIYDTDACHRLPPTFQYYLQAITQRRTTNTAIADLHGKGLASSTNHGGRLAPSAARNAISTISTRSRRTFSAPGGQLSGRHLLPIAAQSLEPMQHHIITGLHPSD